MASLLSNLNNNLAEGIHKIKCNFGHDKENCEILGTKHKDCDSCLEYKNVKDNLNFCVAIIINKKLSLKT